MKGSSYRCTRIGDCIYKNASGLCASPPRHIYLDRYGHYANMTAPRGRYGYRACINYCQYRKAHAAKGRARVTARRPG